jgi:hypothetical protein
MINVLALHEILHETRQRVGWSDCQIGIQKGI